MLCWIVTVSGILACTAAASSGPQPLPQQPQHTFQQQFQPQQQQYDLSIILNFMNETTIDQILSNPDTVQEMVLCFENPPACENPMFRTLLLMLPQALSQGGRCDTCTPEQTIKLQSMLEQAILGLQLRHGGQWTKLLGFTANLF